MPSNETTEKASKAAKSIAKNKGVKTALIVAICSFALAFALTALNIWLGFARITP